MPLLLPNHSFSEVKHPEVGLSAPVGDSQLHALPGHSGRFGALPTQSSKSRSTAAKDKMYASMILRASTRL